MENVVRLKKDELEKLLNKKLQLAGLSGDHALQVAQHLAYADSLGVHSHGSIRVEYYSERISKGGSTVDANITFTRTGPCSGIVDGDNAVGFVVANEGIDQAIQIAKENGIAVIGMRRMGHCGTLSYYLRKVAAENLIGMSMCQSDPMVVPYGGAEPFFGTNPIGFACPRKEGQPIVFDMATTVQAWGKVLAARAKKSAIPDDWALGKDGKPTTDPFDIAGLLPIAGAKGYGLMMMVDILAGSLVNVPYGPHVSSMYKDIDKGRELGQLHIVINPEFFGGSNLFFENISRMVSDLHNVKPAEGFEQVIFPGERSQGVFEKYEKEGIPIVKDVYEYLISDDIYRKSYDLGDAFA